jgi:hypothetical protein
VIPRYPARVIPLAFGLAFQFGVIWNSPLRVGNPGLTAICWGVYRNPNNTSIGNSLYFGGGIAVVLDLNDS